MFFRETEETAIKNINTDLIRKKLECMPRKAVAAALAHKVDNLTVAQAAQAFCVSRSSVYEHCDSDAAWHAGRRILRDLGHKKLTSNY